MPASNIFSANSTSFLNRSVPTSSAQPMQVAPGSVPMAMPQCNLIWVKDQEEVLNYVKAPNEVLYFGSMADDSIMWVRETDANGNIKNPIHLIHCTIEEVPFGPEAQFVTKGEHKELFDLVKQMSEKLDKFEELLK